MKIRCRTKFFIGVGADPVAVNNLCFILKIVVQKSCRQCNCNMSPFATAQLLSYLNCAVHVSSFQVNDTLKFLVTLQDEVGNGLPNNLVAIPVTLIILDKNDNAPIFKDVSNDYHCFKAREYEPATSAMAGTCCLKVRALCPFFIFIAVS